MKEVLKSLTLQQLKELAAKVREELDKRNTFMDEYHNNTIGE